MKQFPRMTAKKASLPIIGTWKLLTSSTSHPDLPHPKSMLTTIASAPDGLAYKAETTWSDGRSTVAEAILRLDGSWQPMTGGAMADSVRLRMVDDHSYEGELRKGGAESGKNRMRISSDGQAMLTEWEFAAPGGQTIFIKTTAERT